MKDSSFSPDPNDRPTTGEELQPATTQPTSSPQPSDVPPAENEPPINDALRQQFVIAEGPNTDGANDMAREAHKLPDESEG